MRTYERERSDTTVFCASHEDATIRSVRPLLGPMGADHLPHHICAVGLATPTSAWQQLRAGGPKEQLVRLDGPPRHRSLRAPPYRAGQTDCLDSSRPPHWPLHRDRTRGGRSATTWVRE